MIPPKKDLRSQGWNQLFATQAFKFFRRRSGTWPDFSWYRVPTPQHTPMDTVLQVPPPWIWVVKRPEDFPLHSLVVLRVALKISCLCGPCGPALPLLPSSLCFADTPFPSVIPTAPSSPPAFGSVGGFVVLCIGSPCSLENSPHSGTAPPCGAVGSLEVLWICHRSFKQPGTDPEAAHERAQEQLQSSQEATQEPCRGV